MIDRRSFLRTLLALPLAELIDVEELIWIPKQLVVVPAMPRLLQPSMITEINNITYRMIMPGLADTYFKVSPFHDHLMMHGKSHGKSQRQAR